MRTTEDDGVEELIQKDVVEEEGGWKENVAKRNGERTWLGFVLCTIIRERERTLRRLWLFLPAAVDHFFLAAGISFQSCQPPLSTPPPPSLVVATRWEQETHALLGERRSSEEVIYAWRDIRKMSGAASLLSFRARLTIFDSSWWKWVNMDSFLHLKNYKGRMVFIISPPPLFLNMYVFLFLLSQTGQTISI